MAKILRYTTPGESVLRVRGMKPLTVVVDGVTSVYVRITSARLREPVILGHDAMPSGIGEYSASFDLTSIILSLFDVTATRDTTPTKADAFAVSFKWEIMDTTYSGEHLAFNGFHEPWTADMIHTLKDWPLIDLPGIAVYDGFPITIMTFNDSGVVFYPFEFDKAETLPPSFVPMPVDACTPVSPFWVRWINSWGGMDYFMFSQRQTFGTTLSKTQRYRVRYNDTLPAMTHRQYEGERVDTVSFSASMLEAPAFSALKNIALSPMCQFWDGQRWVWLNINKVSTTDLSDNVFKSITFEAELPQSTANL